MKDRVIVMTGGATGIERGHGEAAGGGRGRQGGGRGHQRGGWSGHRRGWAVTPSSRPSTSPRRSRVIGLMTTAVDTSGRLDGLFSNAADLRPETLARDSDIVEMETAALSPRPGGGPRRALLHGPPRHSAPPRLRGRIDRRHQFGSHVHEQPGAAGLWIGQGGVRPAGAPHRGGMEERRDPLQRRRPGVVLSDQQRANIPDRHPETTWPSTALDGSQYPNQPTTRDLASVLVLNPTPGSTECDNRGTEVLDALHPFLVEGPGVNALDVRPDEGPDRDLGALQLRS